MRGIAWDFALFIQHRGNFLSKDLFSCKMKVNRNKLKVIVKQGVEIDTDFNKGKRLTQNKYFHPEDFSEEVVSSYQDNSTSDEDFTEYCKVR